MDDSLKFERSHNFQRKSLTPNRHHEHPGKSAICTCCPLFGGVGLCAIFDKCAREIVADGAICLGGPHLWYGFVFPKERPERLRSTQLQECQTWKDHRQVLHSGRSNKGPIRKGPPGCRQEEAGKLPTQREEGR
jgi:hypothetical protein